MKILRQIFLFVFSLFFLFVIGLSLFSAQEAEISSFSAIVKVNEKDISISWWKGNGKNYLFLPSDADLSSVTISFTATSKVIFDGEELLNNSIISLETGKDYIINCSDRQYVLEVLKSDNIPSMHITTVSGSMEAVHADKNYKEEASVVIVSNGEVILEKPLQYIKGRGNASWDYEKKPYNIKFNNKIDLFGMGKEKKWALLANYIDLSIIRNHFALNLAKELGIPFTSEHVYVDLYINNEYYGNYVLCESVEVGETRVDITDLEELTEHANIGINIEECAPGGDHTNDYHLLKSGTQKWYQIPKNPLDITGGYLLEYELPFRYINDPSGFVTNRNQTIVVKSPEYVSEAQIKYISAFYQKFEDAVYSNTGYNAEGKHYSEYIDLDSFVRMYVFQEYIKNIDAGLTSFYIYKDSNSDKFVAAPVWDFDQCLGGKYERYGMKLETPTGWWAGVIYHWTDNDINTLPTVLNALYKHDDFFELASKEWNNIYPNIITKERIDELSSFADEITASASMNAIRYNFFETIDYNSTAEAYRNFVDNSLLNFIKERKTFLDKGFSNNSVRIFYNANGGFGNMFTEGAPQLTETFIVPECNFLHPVFGFDSWNTKADGSGTKYNPGDTIILENKKITFYAQWKGAVATPEEQDNSFVEK